MAKPIKKSLYDEPTIFLMKKLWHYATHLRSRIVLYLTLLVIANCVLLATPLIFGAIIKEVQENGVNQENLLYLTILLVLLFLKELVFWIFHGPARVIERLVAFTAVLNYRRHLLQGVINLRLDWHAEQESGNIIDKVNKAGEGLSEFGQNIFQIVQIIVRLLGTSLVLLWFSPSIGISVFIFVIAAFVIIFQFDKHLIVHYRGLNELSNKATAAVFDALSNITSVKILHIEKSVVEGVVARFRASAPLYRDNTYLNEWKWFTGNMCFHAISVVPLALYIYFRVKQGQAVDAGTLSTLYLYLSDILFVFFGFGHFYELLTIYKNRVLNAEGLEHAFETKSSLTRKPFPEWEYLRIKNLSFSYDPFSAPNLNHVSLTVKKGERIALIGESGSGKTTFLKVIHGMYASASGAIAYNEEPFIPTSFADIDLKTMIVPQDPEIFSSTIRENITLGLLYSEDEVLHAARLARFESVVAGLPKGLDSVINEKGVNLSGGQRQRLALARALLFSTHKDIVLLDESTSSVDPDNEQEIYNNIWHSFKEKTIIASIHKLNLLRLFDRIVIFEKSHIIDVGSFEELYERNAGFRTMWEEFIGRE